MPNPRVQVDLVAENKDLAAKLAAAQAQLDAFAKKNEGKAGEGGAVGEGVDVLKGIKHGLHEIAIPAAILGALNELASKYVEIVKESELVGAAQMKMANDFIAAANEIGRLASGGPLEEMLSLDRKAGEVLTRIGEEADKRAFERGQHSVGSWWQAITEAFGAPDQDAYDAAANAASSLAIHASEAAKKRLKQSVDEVQKFSERAAIIRANLDSDDASEREKAAAEHQARLNEIARLGDSDANAAKKQALEEIDALESALAVKRLHRAEQDLRAGRESAVRGQETELANTDTEREEIAHQERIAAIRKEFRDREDQESIEAFEKRMENETAIYEKHKKLQAQAAARQIRELVEQLRKAQTDGFLPKDVNFSNVGSGAAIQFLEGQLPQVLGLMGGGH
jgi:hypothetical protein